MVDTVTPTAELTERRWPFTPEEEAEAVRKLAARPDLLDKFLLELVRIALDVESPNRWRDTPVPELS